MDANEYERKIQDLCEAVEILEHKLQKTADQKSKILQKLKDTEDDNEKYQNQIAKMSEFEMRQTEDINRLRDNIHDLSLNNKNVICFNL